MMKRFAFFSVVMICWATLHAQNTLQFNQVINIDLTGTSPAAGGSHTLQAYTATVPPGKLWKVEASSCRLEYSGYNAALIYGTSANNSISIFLDNAPISNISSSNTNFSCNTHPMWLAAGNHTFVLRMHNYTGDIMTGYGKVSAIEFNVVP